MERPLAIAMKPAPPKSILKLNDDCMAEVLNYLSVDDVFKVVQTDARFRSSARLRFSSPKLAIDQINKEFIQKYPRDLLDLFFEAFGKTATQIQFTRLPESEFVHIVSYFSQLQNLTLREITITEATDALPLGLEHLEIHRCDIADSVMNLWFPKLAPNLRRMRITATSLQSLTIFDALNSVNQLTELEIDGWSQFESDVLATFIRQNIDLTSLTITIYMVESWTLSNEGWNSIASLQKLEHLNIDARELENSRILEPAQLFPSLKTLTLGFRDSATKSIIESLACESSLTSLSLTEYDAFDLPLSSFKRFENLQNLKLFGSSWYGVRDCPQLPQLQSLNLDFTTFETAEDVTEILEHMPNLRMFHARPLRFFSDRISTNTLLKRISLLNKSRAHPMEVEVEVFDQH